PRSSNHRPHPAVPEPDRRPPEDRDGPRGPDPRLGIPRRSVHNGSTIRRCPALARPCSRRTSPLAYRRRSPAEHLPLRLLVAHRNPPPLLGSSCRTAQFGASPRRLANLLPPAQSLGHI